jgi:hypothetical protein
MLCGSPFAHAPKSWQPRVSKREGLANFYSAIGELRAHALRRNTSEDEIQRVWLAEPPIVVDPQERITSLMNQTAARDLRHLQSPVGLESEYIVEAFARTGVHAKPAVRRIATRILRAKVREAIEQSSPKAPSMGFTPVHDLYWVAHNAPQVPGVEVNRPHLARALGRVIRALAERPVLWNGIHGNEARLREMMTEMAQVAGVDANAGLAPLARLLGRR